MEARVESANLCFLEHHLGTYLPPVVRVVHGAEIASSDGQTSSEMDLVVSNPEVPSLYRSPAFEILPIEAVHGSLK